jgi:hypothetical protein
MLITFSSTTEPPKPGDFEARIEGGNLILPHALSQRLREGQIRTAEDLVGFLQVFPGALASDLGWRVADVHLARRALLALLRGHLADEFFHEEPSFSPRYGVSGGSR